MLDIAAMRGAPQQTPMIPSLSEQTLELASTGAILLLPANASFVNLVHQTTAYISGLCRTLFGVQAVDDLSSLHTFLAAEQRHGLHSHIHARPLDCNFVAKAFAEVLAQGGLAEDTLLSWKPHFRLHAPHVPNERLKPTPPHRDSFYGLPARGINLWVACTAAEGTSVLFYPNLFGRPLRTTSYDPQTFHPKVLEVDFTVEPQIIPDCAAGDCLVFSGEHLHRTPVNLSSRTRISWDYRVLPIRALEPSLRLSEFVLTSSLLHELPHSERERVTQSRLRALASKRAYFVRGLSVELPQLEKARTLTNRVVPNIPYYFVREVRKRAPAWARRKHNIRRVFTYPKQLLFPGHRYAAFRRAVAYLVQTDLKWRQRGSEFGLQLGCYMEFGVWNGDSMLELWKVIRDYVGEVPDSQWHMHGFDSFVGLPAPKGSADAHPFVAQAGFRSQGRAFVEDRLVRAGVPAARFDLHQGMFDELLTEDLKQRLGRPKVSFVNIDVDYHSSTIQALRWVEDLLLDGSLIYFDDIFFYNGNPNKGQLRAIAEFNAASKERGLYPVSGLDPWGRVYSFWRESPELTGERLQFAD